MEIGDIAIVVGAVIGLLVLAAIIQTWIVVHDAAAEARKYYRRANIDAAIEEAEAEEADRLARSH